LADLIIELIVIQKTKGGFRLEFNSLFTYLPSSQIKHLFLVNKILGKIIPIKIIDVKSLSNRCVCSNMKALDISNINEAFYLEFSIGSLVSGFVQNVCSFGVFIDVSFSVGLLHISQISNDRINNIYEMFHFGEPVLINL